jgi:hypothetical protein
MCDVMRSIAERDFVAMMGVEQDLFLALTPGPSPAKWERGAKRLKRSSILLKTFS